MRPEIYLDYARLAAPPPAAFIARLKKALGGLDRYPDTDYKLAKGAIARRHKVNAGNIALGNGVDELIDSITRLGKEEVIIPTPTFGQYETAAKRMGRKIKLIDCISVAGFDLAALEPHLPEARLIWICNPNNPMGCGLDTRQIEDIANRTGGLVVVDEACIGFPEKNTLICQAPKRKNMVVLRTFSKSFGLAGLRIGYAVANPDLIAQLESIRQPFNVNLLAQEAIPLALQMESAFKARYLKMAERREKLSAALVALGYDVMPSETNFVTWKMADKKAAIRLFKRLRSRRIHILPPGSDEFSGMPGNWLRITVGSEFENRLLIKAAKDWQ